MGRIIRPVLVSLLCVWAGSWPGFSPAVLSARQSGAPPQAAGQAPPAGQPQQTPPGQQPPVFRAGVNFVRVDVIVTDRQGEPITDLTADDFEIVEDGQAQAIELFKVISTDGTPGPGAEPARPIRSMYDQEIEAARDDVRLFVVFLDDYHVRLGNSMRVREPLSKFIQSQLGPLDMVAVMYPLTPVAALDFTRDHDSVISAIRRFEGRKYDYRPRNPLEEQYIYYPAQTIETIRNQVTISALEGLSVRLGSLREGRKAVIFVSEGFTALLPPQLRDPMAAMPGLGNPSRRNPLAGDNLTEERERFLSEVELQNLMRDVYDAANRNNTAFYALDPRGLAAGEFDISENVNMRVDSATLRQSQDTLRVLAEETEGRAIVNQNDLERGLRQIIRDTSSYYLVGYSSTAKTDGRFHKIDVRVKRPSVQVRARKGYWAATAEEAAAAAAPPKPKPPAEVERALGAVESRPRDAVVASWTGVSEAQNGLTRVTFVWEPVPAPPGITRQEPVAVQLTASDAGGETIYRGRVPEPGGEADPAATGPARPLRVTFDSKPGRIQLRLSVENDRGQVIDSSAQEVAVPDLTGNALRVSIPALYRGRTPREYQSLTREPDPVPTALREFRRTDRVFLRFEAAAPGTTRPDVAVWLLNRNGQRMTELAVKAPPEGATYYQVDLPLASLAAGGYVLEVGAKSGEASVAELVAIRVTS